MLTVLHVNSHEFLTLKKKYSMPNTASFLLQVLVGVVHLSLYLVSLTLIYIFAQILPFIETFSDHLMKVIPIILSYSTITLYLLMMTPFSS